MKLEGKNILVTGGAGFIGSHLVDRLIDETPGKLVVVDNFFLGKEENLSEARVKFPDLKIYRLDASDLAAMRDLTTSEQIEVVFNLAVIPLPTSLQYPTWTININMGIATTFCDLARWGNIKTLIHCSSSEAYGSALYSPMDEDHPLQPSTPYAASKAGSDLTVLSYQKTFGIDAVIVRPFNNYGPRQNPGTYAGIIPIVTRRILRGEPIEIFGDGDQTRDFLYVKDTANAFVEIYEREGSRGQVINVATGKETSVNSLVSQIKQVMGAPQHEVFHSKERPGDVRRHCGNVQRFCGLTGFQPPAIKDEYILDTVNWYQRSGLSD
jgi:UDP-glucose 4-epimerase